MIFLPDEFQTIRRDLHTDLLPNGWSFLLFLLYFSSSSCPCPVRYDRSAGKLDCHVRERSLNGSRADLAGPQPGTAPAARDLGCPLPSSFLSSPPLLHFSSLLSPPPPFLPLLFSSLLFSSLPSPPLPSPPQLSSPLLSPPPSSPLNQCLIGCSSTTFFLGSSLPSLSAR
eukprot:736284-Hanusia_phi.AAC.1